MFWFLVLVAVVVVAYIFRVPLLAKILGQPEERIQRALDRRKKG
jgi:hypothetical protein